ncbi:MAG: 50S ribosomal protein L11 methyltransferase, partial [Chthoniobacterales bacterium]
MTNPKRMYLWKFHATPTWRAAHEADLEAVYAGNLAVIDLQGKARALVQVICCTKAQADELVRRFGGTLEKLTRDWQTKFLAAEKRAPLRIGKRLVVVMEAHAQASMEQLVIPAAGAFGTGDHATTAMCLRLLEETSRRFPAGWSLLDAGTGTGILALAGRRFGAQEVLGIDNDPRAVAHARTNARLNQIRGTKFVSGDFLRWNPEQGYDVITANLFSELRISALPLFRCTLSRDGTLILSGILRAQAPEVIRAL